MHPAQTTASVVTATHVALETLTSIILPSFLLDRHAILAAARGASYDR
jgi:hypothetical protein